MEKKISKNIKSIYELPDDVLVAMDYIRYQDVKFRISQTGLKGPKGQPWAMCLIYIDARTAHDGLDKKFGELNWSFNWKHDDTQKWAIRGILKVKNGEEWIIRSDIGYPQNTKKFSKQDDTEWLKDAISDALKRCAIQFGIGRILYEGPDLFTGGVRVAERNGKKKVTKLDSKGNVEIQEKIRQWYIGMLEDRTGYKIKGESLNF